MKSKPHIILIVLDTLRADKTFGSFSNKKLTPFMEKLLEKSFYFTNCISNTVWTFPSHCTMFTGLYHSQIKEINTFSSLGYKIPTVTQILKENGYNTLCYTENSYISKIFQLTKGFDEIVNNYKKGFIWLYRNIRLKFLLESVNNFEKKVFRYIHSKKVFSIWKNIKRKIEALIFTISIRLFWKYNIYNFENISFQEIKKFGNIIQNLTKKEQKFIFFNIMAPHEPYNPPKEILELFEINEEDLKIYRDLSFHAHEFKVYMNQISKKFNFRYANTLNKFYDASIYYTDVILKYIFRILRQNELLKNSYIIITSDHGELLGGKEDHYLWGHSMPLKSVHKSLIHVPLLIYHEAFGKQCIEHQVQLKDIFHTILDLAHVSEEKYNLFTQKNSLLTQISQKSTPKYIYGEFLKNEKYINDILLITSHKLGTLIEEHLDSKMKNDIWFIRSNQYKYINYGNDYEEFFDIVEDPYEMNNIIKDKTNECKRFQEFLQFHQKEMREAPAIKSFITKDEKDKIGEAISSKFKNIKFKI
ncbi:MAG: hypothetical protein BAJALOKI1v1_240012 [Promethearchaeota archaeon]|nr:MAG: hypothetical protein BAJALOKI1v1_240012 [Candidatus Lokiarchaeota archaeon]